MITETGVEKMWVKGGVQARYLKLERARPYAMTRDAQRFLVWLWVSCEKLEPSEPEPLFKWALEQLADAGVNVLQPLPPNELKAPEAGATLGAIHFQTRSPPTICKDKVCWRNVTRCWLNGSRNSPKAHMQPQRMARSASRCLEEKGVGLRCRHASRKRICQRHHQ